jgi:Skp family chaperone for outer membrane proteins
MRFHLTMMMVVLAVSLAMHALASAGEVPADPARAQAYQGQLQEAGLDLNRALQACREQARRDAHASRRELKACERAAQQDFRQDVRQARSQRGEAG